MANSLPLNPLRRWRKMTGPGELSLIRRLDHGKKRSDGDEYGSRHDQIQGPLDRQFRGRKRRALDFDGKLRANLAGSLSEQATNMIVRQKQHGNRKNLQSFGNQLASSAIAPFQCKQDKLHIVHPGRFDCVIYDRDVTLKIPSRLAATNGRPHADPISAKSESRVAGRETPHRRW